MGLELATGIESGAEEFNGVVLCAGGEQTCLGKLFGQNLFQYTLLRRRVDSINRTDWNAIAT
jgi:hypothetical protein